MYKKCKLCGQIFLPYHGNVQYCSDSCKNAARKKYQRKWKESHPYYHNQIAKIFTQDFINSLKTNTYCIDDLPVLWQKREKESPGYLLSIAELYNECNFTCEITGRSGSAVHHLNGYHWDVQGRCDKSNMIIINKNIHNFFHFLYGHKHNTIEQFNNFLNTHFSTSIDTILHNRGVYYCN